MCQCHQFFDRKPTDGISCVPQCIIIQSLFQVVTTVDTMTVPLSEVFFPSVVVCNINQVRKSFFEELGIYDNETFIRQIYFDFIEGKSR